MTDLLGRMRSHGAPPRWILRQRHRLESFVQLRHESLLTLHQDLLQAPDTVLDLLLAPVVVKDFVKKLKDSIL